LRRRSSEGRKTRPAFGRLRDSIPYGSLRIPGCRTSGRRCVERASVGDTRKVRTDACGDEIRKLATALDLERVPRAEKICLFLFFFEKVDDEVDDRRRCVEVAVEDVPESRDEVARTGLGSYVIAQSEFCSCNGVGRVRGEGTEAREYRRVSSVEKGSRVSGTSFMDQNKVSTRP
jgi:hypothetical protein